MATVSFSLIAINKTSGQRILTRGRIAGLVDFLRGEGVVVTPANLEQCSWLQQSS